MTVAHDISCCGRGLLPSQAISMYYPEQKLQEDKERGLGMNRERRVGWMTLGNLCIALNDPRLLIAAKFHLFNTTEIMIGQLCHLPKLLVSHSALIFSASVHEFTL